MIRVEVDVAKDARHRPARCLGRRRRAGRPPLVVYDKIDAIKVTPQAGMARVGGINFPKQFQQFEAIAYHNGADGKPDTKDDLNLGPVDVTWSIEEYTATFDDDDKEFVGTHRRHGPVHAQRRRTESEAQGQRATTSATSG